MEGGPFLGLQQFLLPECVRLTDVGMGGGPIFGLQHEEFSLIAIQDEVSRNGGRPDFRIATLVACRGREMLEIIVRMAGGPIFGLQHLSQNAGDDGIQRRNGGMPHRRELKAQGSAQGPP